MEEMNWSNGQSERFYWRDCKIRAFLQYLLAGNTRAIHTNARR